MGDNRSVTISLGVAAVARRLGVAPATLRTWDRRYGLGPSDHADGAHRRYTPTDLARLEHMQRLIRAGVGAREAAAEALTAGARLAAVATPPSPAIPGVLDSAVFAARGLRRAINALDVDSAALLLSTQIAERGVIWTWEQLIAPLLISIGEIWAESGKGVETEHALSEIVSAAFSRVTGALEPGRERAVLLAAAPDDLHTLALEAVGAALAERGIGSRFLGARVPVEALEMAIRRTGPRAVVVWATNPVWVDMDDLARIRPAPRCAVAGPGWGTKQPEGWARLSDLSSAVTQLAAWVGPDPLSEAMG